MTFVSLTDYLQLSISHVWPFNVAKCCQRNKPDNGPLHWKNNTASQRTGQTSQPSLHDEAPAKVCFSQIAPAGTAQFLPRSGRNLGATIKIQLLQGRVAQEFQQVCGPIGTFGVFVKAPRLVKKGLRGKKDCNLLPLLLQVIFVSPTIWNCLFHIFGLSMLSNLMSSKKQP